MRSGEAVKQAPELCLDGRGCKQECPVNVNIATCKVEFRAHPYRGRRRPRAFYSMGLTGTWARLGSKPPVPAHLARTIAFGVD
jgi:Fe-S oxidoreductase